MGDRSPIPKPHNPHPLNIDQQRQVWDPAVRFFKVYDAESKQHIASFYLDPYSRPENKRGGAWMDVCTGMYVGVDVYMVPGLALPCLSHTNQVHQNPNRNTKKQGGPRCWAASRWPI